MQNYKTQNHVLWDCTYHVIIVPKYRKKVLYGPVRQRTGTILRQLAKQKEIEVVEGNACPDHIHMILSIPPKHSVAYAIGFMKGKSAILLHQEFGNRRTLTQKSFWSRGYCVSTIGLDKETVRKYVQDQWKKDIYIDGPQLDLKWN